MKPLRSKFVLTCVWLLAALCPRVVAADSPLPLLVVEVSEADDLAARRLLSLTEQPTQLVRMAEASEPARALALARAAGARQVVIFDQAQQHVVVLRTEDGAQWLRTTDASEATPFVAAFVAVELLALSAGAAAATRPAAAARPAAAPPVAPRWGTAWLGLRLGLDALVSAPYATSARPSVGALAAFARRDAAWALLLELQAAPHGRHQQRLGDGRLQLTRSDLTARAGALWQRRRWGISSFAQAGVLLIEASYRGSTAKTETRKAFVAGLGLEPNLQLTPWLRLYVSAIAQIVGPRGEYRASAQSALREPRFGLQVGAGLWLTLPTRH